MKNLTLFSAVLALLCTTHIVISADQQSDLQIVKLHAIRKSIEETQSYINELCHHSNYPTIDNHKTCDAASEHLKVLHNLMKNTLSEVFCKTITPLVSCNGLLKPLT